MGEGMKSNKKCLFLKQMLVNIQLAAETTCVGGGGVEHDQISDIPPTKIEYQISHVRKKSDIWLKKSDIRPPKKSIIRYHTP